jgi:hypothetical protein
MCEVLQESCGNMASWAFGGGSGTGLAKILQQDRPVHAFLGRPKVIPGSRACTKDWLP